MTNSELVSSLKASPQFQVTASIFSTLLNSEQHSSEMEFHQLNAWLLHHANEVLLVVEPTEEDEHKFLQIAYMNMIEELRGKCSDALLGNL